MKKLAIIMIVVMGFTALAVSADEPWMFTEGSLFYGEGSVSTALVVGSRLGESPLGALLSTVSLGVPGWEVTAVGGGIGYWGDGVFIGGGFIPQKDHAGAFASVLVWNDDFYLSFLGFFPSIEQCSLRLFVEGPFQAEGGLLEGRIETTFSTVISGDGGFLLRSDKIFRNAEGLLGCLLRHVWLKVGAEAAWQKCPNGTPDAEFCWRQGLRVDLGNASLDLNTFIQSDLKGWAAEASLHLSLPLFDSKIGDAPARASPSSFLINRYYFASSPISFNYSQFFFLDI
jgi:hypothetical protein